MNENKWDGITKSLIRYATEAIEREKREDYDNYIKIINSLERDDKNTLYAMVNDMIKTEKQ